MTGRADEVIAPYLDHYRDKLNLTLAHSNSNHDSSTFLRWGTHEIEITRFRFLDAAGREQTTFQSGDCLTAEFTYQAHQPIPEPEFGLAIFHEDGLHVSGPNSQIGGLTLPEVEGHGVIRCRLGPLPLLPATYQVTAAIYDKLGTHPYDHHDKAYLLRVVAHDAWKRSGVVELPAEWEWQATAEPLPLR
jgi:hypothetical protein